MIRPTQPIIPIIILLAFNLFLYGCRHHSSVGEKMDKAERLLSEAPDSSLHILEEIPSADIIGEKEKARYAILKTIALDKNYIDTTSFEIIQPAVDYYLKKGNADEKLRILYYSGRIFQNQGDEESAIKEFMKALDLKDEIKDSLLFAHNYVLLGILNLQQYKIDKYIKYNTLAADMYSKIGDEYDLIKSYSKILHGYVLSNNKVAADSILSISKPLITKNPENNNIFFWSFLSYNVKYGSKEELMKLLNTVNYKNLPKDDQLDFVAGFARLGEFEKAMAILNNLTMAGSTDDTLKYLAVKTDLYDKKGDYKEAYKNYKAFSLVSEREQWNLRSKDILFAEERHNLEIVKLSAIGAKNRLIVYILSATLSLFIFFIILVFRYRISKAKRIITEKDNENLRLEQENMKKEMEKIELQRDKKILEAANLNLEKSRLESERDNLKEIIKNSSELTMPLQDIVRERLDKLNSLLAKEIAGKDKYADSYTKWVGDVQKNKDKFMKSTRLAFTATHPLFIDYLNSFDLEEDEINYLCLFALGLRINEVGAYAQIKNVYIHNSKIREKLGLQESDTNLDIYIRRKLNELR